jgi:hypothetical protein
LSKRLRNTAIWQPQRTSRATPKLRRCRPALQSKRRRVRVRPRQEIFGSEYLSPLDRYALSVSYRAELARLRPKLRRIREFQINHILKVLCEKVRCKVIKNAKDFRKLIPIFLRAGANEQHIHRFLCDPDMTISELERLAARSEVSRLGHAQIGPLIAHLWLAHLLFPGPRVR